MKEKIEKMKGDIVQYIMNYLDEYADTMDIEVSTKQYGNDKQYIFKLNDVSVVIDDMGEPKLFLFVGIENLTIDISEEVRNRIIKDLEKTADAQELRKVNSFYDALYM